MTATTTPPVHPLGSARAARFWAEQPSDCDAAGVPATDVDPPDVAVGPTTASAADPADRARRKHAAGVPFR